MGGILVWVARVRCGVLVLVLVGVGRVQCSVLLFCVSVCVFDCRLLSLCCAPVCVGVGESASVGVCVSLFRV